MRSFLLFLAILGTSLVGLASHISGGQIDYHFTSTGQLVVSLHVYRECDGLPQIGNTIVTAKSLVGNQSVSISVTITGRDTIALTCYDTSQTIGCAPGTTYIEVIHYQSSPVTLSGINFAQGFSLQWDQCCLPIDLENLTSPMTSDMFVHTVVTPPLDSAGNAMPYGSYADHSPVGNFMHLFSQEMGVDNRLELGMLDPDGDSLHYSFSQPLDNLGNPLALTPGYTAQIPFSNPVQNGANVPPLVNPYTGTITYTAYAQGNFYYSVAVESWRGNQRLSTVYRPQVLKISNNNVSNGNPLVVVNALPNSMSIVPLDSSGLVYGAFGYPGDSLIANIQATDFDLNGPAFLPQMVTLEVAGTHLGNPINSSTGCAFGPCATFTPTMGTMTGAQMIGGQLKWQLDSAQLAPIFGFDTKYILARFDAVVTDDACGLNGMSRLQLYVLYHNGDTANAVIPGIGLAQDVPHTYAVYPNPIGNEGFELIGTAPFTNKELVLYNNQGQVIKRETIHSNDRKLRITWANHLPNGLYFLSIGGEKTLKLVK